MSIRVMVVDDEPIAAKATSIMIRKADDTMEVVAQCHSGREAVSKAALLHPDIIVMDIQMPGINGLEAMRRIRETNPQTCFIILSAHSEFAYAVEALSLGASDYLLKPIKQVNFTASLQKAAADILARKEDMDLELEQQERVQIAEPMIRKDFIRALLPDAASDERLIVCAGFLCIADQPGFAIAIGPGRGGSGSMEEALDGLPSQPGMIAELVRPDLTVAFVSLAEEEQAAEAGARMEALLSRSLVGGTLLAGVGGVEAGPLRFKVSLLQAIGALEYLRGLEQPALRCAGFDPEVMELPGEAGCWEQPPPDHHPSTRKIVETATRFIEENHHRELSLDEVASHVNLSPYYFSRFFKEYTGSNFSELLLQVRIDHAKALLSMPGSSVKDVAYRVGYNDPNYFSRVFRKATGIRASDYRTFSEQSVVGED